jgi:hypothetical protein
MNDLPPSEFPPEVPAVPPEPPPGYAVPSPPPAPLNPWLSIWTRPRATMRQILDANPRPMVHLLAILGTMVRMLTANIPALGPFGRPSLATILTLKIGIAVVGGLLGLYLGSAILLMTGRWLGGRGGFVAVRAAVAWANVPLIWTALLWLPLFGYLGADAFNLDPTRLLEEPAGLALMVPLGLIETVIAVWYIVIALKCLAEAHGFSAWHALGAALIGFLILLVPFAILVGLAIGMLGLSGALHM